MMSQRFVGPSLARALLAVALATLTLLALHTARAGAVPGSQVWTGQPGGPTPDILRGGLTLLSPSGAPVQTGASVGTLNFSLDGVRRVGYCTDATRTFSTGTEPVDVEIEDPPAGTERRALTWLLLNRTPEGPVTPAKAAEAAAAQVAAWLLVDPEISKTTPTSDPAINAAALALVREALAVTDTPASLTMSIPAPAPGATTATLSIRGRPGAEVDLAITSGSGSLSANRVTILADGSATVTVTSTSLDTIIVQGTTVGNGRLIRIRPTDGVRQSQPTAAAERTTIVTTAQALFVAATRPAVAQVTRPRLTVSKTAPARSAALQLVRYVITVRNPSDVTVRNVVLRDRLPRGLSFVRSSREGTLRDGTITFQLGSLAPKQSRTVRIWLRPAVGVVGTRTNVATVQATQVRPLSARVQTLFVALQRRVRPAIAVTG